MKRDGQQKFSKLALQEIDAERFVMVAIEFANQVFSDSVSQAEQPFWSQLGIKYEFIGNEDARLEEIRKHQNWISYRLSEIVRGDQLAQAHVRLLHGYVRDHLKLNASFDGQSITFKQVTQAGGVAVAMIGLAFIYHYSMQKRVKQCERCENFFFANRQQLRAKFCPGECADQNEYEKSQRRLKNLRSDPEYRKRKKQEAQRGEHSKER